ncbi:MAG: hypothetical protein IJ736_00180, partial [Firmicutes bacterium]|nr:hypothetical protein [Bacillota bacterium]
MQEGLTIDLQSVSTSESSTAYIVAAFNNSYTELTRIANAGVLVNGNKLNYNSNYSQLSSVNSSDCIVTGNTIQFYTSSLSEGENTITFVNPDDNTKNVSVTLTMSKSGDYWSGYTYTVEVIPTGGKSHTSPKTAYEMWEAVGHGAIEENESYIITYKNEDKTYALGAENGVLTTKEISDPTATIDLADGYKWIPEKASSSGYWYLWNQEGSKNKFLSLTGETDYSSYPYKTTYTPSLASKQGYYDKTLYVD